MTETRVARAHKRPAGKNVLHTVEVDGKVVATRRSAHGYNYALCRWTGTYPRRLVVDGWSRVNRTRKAGQFALRVESA